MRDVAPGIASAIEAGTYTAELKFTAFYGNEVTLTDVPVKSWSFESEEGRDIPTVGSLEAVYVDEQGTSITPRSFVDFLAPFGQEILVQCVISADQFAETVVLGRLRLIATPEAHDTNVMHGSRVLTASSTVKLEVADLLHKVQAAGFVGSSSSSKPTYWEELAHLTGMRVARSVPNVRMPRVEYEMSPEGRLTACQDIAARLGGTLYVRSDGALTVLPMAQGPVVRRIRIGKSGTRLSEMTRALAMDGLYNEVIGDFEDEERNPIWVPPAQITDGPLSVNGPLGHRTKQVDSNLVKTRDQARAMLRDVLEKSSTLAPVEINVDILLDPRLEIGDTVELEQEQETVTGRIIKVTHDEAGTSLVLAVTATFPELNLGRVDEIY